MDGFGVGVTPTVGKFEGDKVGDLVGTFVGLFVVSALVGLFVVGALVGVCVGGIDGTSVGALLGP